jgi:hypothetical protein
MRQGIVNFAAAVADERLFVSFFELREMIRVGRVIHKQGPAAFVAEYLVAEVV